MSERFEPSVCEPFIMQKFFDSIPYFGSQSVRLANELSALLSKIALHYDFALDQVNRNNIGSLFNYKKTLPISLRSSLVHTFSYARCTCEYVGSTSLVLHTRAREHERRRHRTGATLSVPSHSNIRLHSQLYGVSFSKSDFRIRSACERNLETLLIIQSTFLLRNKPKINDLISAYKLLIC